VTTSTLHTDVDDHGETPYDQACRLIEAELGGRRLTSQPQHWLDELVRTRRHKTALVTAVRENCPVSGLVEACRVVEAVYPYLTFDGLCTEAAVTAAWRIIAPDASTWTEQQQDERHCFTAGCLNLALTEANAKVA
jgi:hypothetical protein